MYERVSGCVKLKDLGPRRKIQIQSQVSETLEHKDPARKKQPKNRPAF